jgi:hypothetical protein
VASSASEPFLRNTSLTRLLRARTIEKFYSDVSTERKTCHQITRMISDYVEV